MYRATARRGTGGPKNTRGRACATGRRPSPGGASGISPRRRQACCPLTWRAGTASSWAAAPGTCRHGWAAVGRGRSGWITPRRSWPPPARAPERGALRGRPQHAGGPDAVTGHIHRTALFAGQRGGHRRDISEFAAQRVGAAVAAGRAAAPVHGGHTPVPGQRIPDPTPAFDGAHAAVHQQQPRARPSAQQSDAHPVRAGDLVPGSLHGQAAYAPPARFPREYLARNSGWIQRQRNYFGTRAQRTRP